MELTLLLATDSPGSIPISWMPKHPIVLHQSARLPDYYWIIPDQSRLHYSEAALRRPWPIVLSKPARTRQAGVASSATIHDMKFLTLRAGIPKSEGS